MLRSTGARRYAQALYGIARAGQFSPVQFDVWAAQLRVMADVINSPELARRLADPAIVESQKLTVVQGALQQSIKQVDPVLLNLAAMLISRDRTRFIALIAEQFQNMLNEARGVI